jgi:hypothetical protein
MERTLEHVEHNGVVVYHTDEGLDHICFMDASRLRAQPLLSTIATFGVQSSAITVIWRHTSRLASQSLNT